MLLPCAASSAQPVDAEGVHDLEGTGFPAVAPLHRAVDRHNVVREFRRERERIVRRIGEMVAQERAVGAGHRHRGRQSLGDRHADGLTDVAAFEALLRDVALGLPVEGLRAVFGLRVKAAARLIAELSLGHQLFEHPRRQREVFAGRTTDAFGDMREYVEARQIAGAERGGARASDEGTGEAVHFIDGESVLLHAPHGADHTVHAKPIGHEARHILRDHDALAQRALGELARGSDHRRIRFRCRDDLEQVHVPRRIEEVRAEEAATEFFAAPFQQHRHRNA
jgi:hypothetical protein